MVEGGGFEPPKAEPTDLQSVPVDRLGIPPRAGHFSASERDCQPLHYNSRVLIIPCLQPPGADTTPTGRNRHREPLPEWRHRADSLGARHAIARNMGSTLALS